MLNYVYIMAQNLVLPASLVLLYRLDRAVYRTLRNTLLATWLLAIPVYALYPAAPPRLAGLGLVDTVSSGSPLKMEGGATTSLVNQFAAVPSLHVGFAFAIGIAVAAALHTPLLRVVALLWGPIVLLSVVATGNHFVFDAFAGLLITAAGYGVARMLATGWPVRVTTAAYAFGTRRRIEPAPAMACRARRRARPSAPRGSTPPGSRRTRAGPPAVRPAVAPFPRCPAAHSRRALVDSTRRWRRRAVNCSSRERYPGAAWGVERRSSPS